MNGKGVLQQATSEKFDYSAVDPETRDLLLQASEEITRRMKRSLEDIIAMGKRLLAIKTVLPHGQFGQWIKLEFGWTARTARNLMAVAHQFGETANFSDLNIESSAAYLLAAPSVPEGVREEALRRAREGERITHAVAREILYSVTGRETSQHDLQRKDMLLESLANVVERVCQRWPEDDIGDVIAYMETLLKQISKRTRNSY